MGSPGGAKNKEAVALLESIKKPHAKAHEVCGMAEEACAKHQQVCLTRSRALPRIAVVRRRFEIDMRFLVAGVAAGSGLNEALGESRRTIPTDPTYVKSTPRPESAIGTQNVPLSVSPSIPANAAGTRSTGPRGLPGVWGFQAGLPPRPEWKDSRPFGTRRQVDMTLEGPRGMLACRSGSISSNTPWFSGTDPKSIMRIPLV